MPSQKTQETETDLEPPDPERCQAGAPTGHTFMTLGGQPGHTRCSNEPVVIATEAESGKNGRRGSMSLCARCLTVFTKQMPPGCATFEAAQDRDRTERLFQAVRDAHGQFCTIRDMLKRMGLHPSSVANAHAHATTGIKQMDAILLGKEEAK